MKEGIRSAPGKSKRDVFSQSRPLKSRSPAVNDMTITILQKHLPSSPSSLTKAALPRGKLQTGGKTSLLSSRSNDCLDPTSFERNMNAQSVVATQSTVKVQSDSRNVVDWSSTETILSVTVTIRYIYNTLAKLIFNCNLWATFCDLF